MIFLACLDLKLARFCFIASDSFAFGFPAVLAPCSPNRIVLVSIWPEDPLNLATTTWLFVGWLGVLFGALYLVTPALFSFGSGFFFAICHGCLFRYRLR